MRNIGEGGRLSAVLTLGAVGLAMAGCGGSGSTQATGSGSSQATGSTQAQAQAPAPARSPTHSSPASAGLITRAEAICSRLNKALIVGHVGLDPRKIAASVPRNAALERRAVVELSRLRAPAKMAADWKKMIIYRFLLAAELSKLANASKADNSASIRALATSKKRVHQQLSALASRDGFTACAHVG
jgi:hypothetical protein